MKTFLYTLFFTYSLSIIPTETSTFKTPTEQCLFCDIINFNKSRTTHINKILLQQQEEYFNLLNSEKVTEKDLSNLKQQHIQELKNIHMLYDKQELTLINLLSEQDRILYESLINEDAQKLSRNYFNHPSYQLFKLCQNKDLEKLIIAQKAQELLEQGADPNFEFNHLSTLHLAIIHIQPDITKLLLESGARITEQNILTITQRYEILQTCYKEQDFDHYPATLFFADAQSLLRIQKLINQYLQKNSLKSAQTNY